MSDGDSKQTNTNGSNKESNFSDKYKTEMDNIFASSIHDAGSKINRAQGALDEIISIYFKKHREVSEKKQLKLTEEKEELKSLGKTCFEDISDFLGDLEKEVNTKYDGIIKDVSESSVFTEEYGAGVLKETNKETIEKVNDYVTPKINEFREKVYNEVGKRSTVIKKNTKKKVWGGIAIATAIALLASWGTATYMNNRALNKYKKSGNTADLGVDPKQAEQFIPKDKYVSLGDNLAKSNKELEDAKARIKYLGTIVTLTEKDTIFDPVTTSYYINYPDPLAGRIRNIGVKGTFAREYLRMAEEDLEAAENARDKYKFSLDSLTELHSKCKPGDNYNYNWKFEKGFKLSPRKANKGENQK